MDEEETAGAVAAAAVVAAAATATDAADAARTDDADSAQAVSAAETRGDLETQSRLWRKRLGNVGEALALCHLTRSGFSILRRKFRVGRSSEIDIVAEGPGGVIVFVEVKTRAVGSVRGGRSGRDACSAGSEGSGRGSGGDACSAGSADTGRGGARGSLRGDWHESVFQTINGQKQRKIISAARRFKIEMGCFDSDCRFDLIVVGLDVELANDFVRLFVADETGGGGELSSAIEVQLRERDLGIAGGAFQLIHCESVFVTNF